MNVARNRPTRLRTWLWIPAAVLLTANAPAVAQKKEAARPAPPTNVEVTDHRWDGGKKIDVSFKLSPQDTEDAKPKIVVSYLIQRSGEFGGKYIDVARVTSEKKAYTEGVLHATIDKNERGERYFFRVYAIGAGGVRSSAANSPADSPAIPTREKFDGGRFWAAVIVFIVCGAVLWYIKVARRGGDLKIRKIAGLEAVEEAVGRATEMGRSCLFIPGVQDMNDIQTIAGLTVLSRVAEVAAEYGARIEVPTSRSLVMTTARETVQSAFLSAGRPDAYNEDDIYYVTDEQFGYVAYLSGMMVREKPAACFYMGSFFAESLILAETGNAIGAIQVAGTAMPAQLPFFVAACDYTLIGEEFFAATAYLSGDPDQLGSLKGQDVGKLLVAGLLILGSGLWLMENIFTAQGNLPVAEFFEEARLYLRDVILNPGA